MVVRSVASRLSLAVLAVSLAACSVLEDNKVDYKSARKGDTLEVPPDLTALAREERYSVQGGGVNASSYQTNTQMQQGLPTATNQVADARIEKSGNKRWLVVNRSPKEVWPIARSFWQDNGFTLQSQQEALGIMETDWAENRAKLPQDFIRETVGKVFSFLYTTSERDKFRTRLEPSADGKSTEIYITHRGLVEQLTNKGGGKDADSSAWVQRDSDPELEAEFLRRLMLRFGLNDVQAKQALAQSAQPATPIAQLAGDTLTLSEGFDPAWRKVGLALDRANFTISDRDRSKGTYFVRYAQATPEEKGFFAKLFGGNKKAQQDALQEYRVVVQASGAEQARVTVQDQTGAPSSTEAARNILKLLSEQL